MSQLDVIEQPAELTRPISYYDGCTGYDPVFLAEPVTLPVLTEEQRRNAATNTGAAADADPTVLPYTHFSIVVNSGRQIAYYTAVNIDGEQAVDVERTRDRWFFDPRIAQSEQIGEDLYARNALDRGHLVRRLDPVWGAASGRANDDTFHFTNCSPQHERFNQGKDLWQGLENYILDNAEALHRKVSVFTGPVLTADDPLYRGVRLPLAFWKVIVYARESGAMASAAYLLEQAGLIEDMLRTRAVFAPGLYRVSVAALTARTGLGFGHVQPFELPLSSGGVERGMDQVRVRDDYSNVAL